MKRKFKASDIAFAILIVLLLVPQTRKPIQVALNKVRVHILSPSAMDVEDQFQLSPFDYNVISLDEAPKSIEIGKGEVTFLSYWATWCPPCIAEMPSIQSLYADYGEKINFVLLTNEEPDKVKAFLDKKGYKLPVFIPQMNAPEALFEKSIPTNYIIDQNGKIIIKEQGASDWNSETVRTALDTLLP